MLADGLLAITIASDCRTDSQLAVIKRTQHTCVLRHSKSSGPATERMGRSEIVRWRLLQLQLDALDRSSEDLAVRGFCREQQPNPQGLTRATLSRSHWAGEAR